eukprot:6880169-Alexandrium_andersonii.AAC.1
MGRSRLFCRPLDRGHTGGIAALRRKATSGLYSFAAAHDPCGASAASQRLGPPSWQPSSIAALQHRGLGASRTPS